MVYSHNMIGQHSFPVILDIHGGRSIPLRLSGITLSESDKYLNFAVDHHQLRPVQLGLMSAPIQQINFFNGSKHKIHYEIELDSVRAINADNWDWKIFRILNPKGVVEASSCGEILVQFSPLEAKDYEIELKVKIIDGEDQQVKICGRGELNYTESPQFLNNSPKIEEQTLCSLSLDRIRLGNVPLGSPVRRIIFLENKSVEIPSQFKWQNHSRFVQITPTSGRLEPGERKLIHIEFCATVDR